MATAPAVNNNCQLCLTQLVRDDIDQNPSTSQFALAAIATTSCHYASFANTPPLQNTHSISEVTQTPSLEDSFKDICLQNVDVNAKVNFEEYLKPNEGTPTGVREHLDLIEEPGIIVSTGTERSFFDLALCNPEKCHGLVVRDINPRVKAYVDFNTMLLRISRDKDEYTLLSEDIPRTVPNRSEKLAERLKIIQGKITLSDIPEHIKYYYLHNLDQFGKVYFDESKNDWRQKGKILYACYEGANYRDDNNLFNILQSYAKAGKIIATIGDINDLRFLNDQKIAVVDISNIPDYCVIDLKGGKNFNPRVIWTTQNPRKTEFHSYIHCPLLPAKREELDKLIEKWIKVGVLSKENALNDLKHLLFLNSFLRGRGTTQQDNHNETCFVYSEKLLDEIKFFQEYTLPKFAEGGIANCKEIQQKLNETATLGAGQK